MATDSVTVTLETDGDSDEIEIPTALLSILGEADDSPPSVVADIALLGFAQQIHGIVHHGQAGGDGELEDAEAFLMERFEERFGQTFGEVTGHSH